MHEILVDGMWKTWSEWGVCSVTCGGGESIRTRECIDALHGGDSCLGESNQTKVCEDFPCPSEFYKVEKY